MRQTAKLNFLICNTSTEITSLYRVLRGENESLDVKNHFKIFQHFVNSSRRFQLYEESGRPNHEKLAPVLLQVAKDVYDQNPEELEDLFGWIGSRIYEPEKEMSAKFKVIFL